MNLPAARVRGIKHNKEGFEVIFKGYQSSYNDNHAFIIAHSKGSLSNSNAMSGLVIVSQGEQTPKPQ